MNITDTYDGSNDPFEGDKTLVWLSLPAGAKLSSAKLTLTPVSAPGGVLFQEEIDFSGTQGDWGATKANGDSTTPFVEVDFHKRRTLVSVNESGATAPSLQVDMGGLYVQINDQGAIKSPGDNLFTLGADGTLPNLTVSKFRLVPTAANPGSPDITRAVIRTVPTNINVRLGKQGPFWPRNGDLTAQDTSPDFADVLQAFLANAQVVNGYYAIPLTIHSDLIARLQAKLDLEFVQQASLMPDAVSEVVLPFDFSSIPKAAPGVLSVQLPPNAQVLPTASTAKVIGAFDDTRVALGPTGDISPAGSVTVASNDSQAEAFSLDSATPAASVDLLVAPQPPGVVVAIDLRNDFDGKPDTTSLLSSPAQSTIPSRPDGQPVWVNIPLGQEVHLLPKDQVKRYWLVVQSLQGQAAWSVQQAQGGTPIMQHTQDGGLSWRETPAPAAASPPAGLFRLRQTPATFQVPIQAQVGTGDQAQLVSLDRFQPLGQVKFDLAVPEFAAGFNGYLSKAVPQGCSAAEHLANGSFEQWLLTGNNPGNVSSVGGVPASSSVAAIAASADDRTAYVVFNVGDGGASLVTVDIGCNRVTGESIDLPSNIGPQGICLYPDESKVLVVGNSQIVLVDLQKSRVLGSASPSTAFTINGLGLSPDGTTAYLLLSNSSTANGAIFSFPLPVLEQAIIADTLANQLQNPASTGNGNPVALAVGQNVVCVLSSVTTGNSVQGVVTFLDPLTLASTGQPASGVGLLALGLTPDGSRVFVADFDSQHKDGVLEIIDSQTRIVTSLRLGVTVPTLAKIAVSPDGQQVYVATTPYPQGITIAVVDLPSKTVVRPISASTTDSISALAMTSLGDELFIGTDNTLLYLPIGVRTPADWFVTSGHVSLRCLPGISDQHIVAVMQGTSARIAAGQPQPAALSQVAPITGGCTYQFSFEGLSNDGNAVAEILWRGQSCQGVKTDTVPIPQAPKASIGTGAASSIVPPAENRAVGTLAEASIARVEVSQSFRLIATSVRLTAPQDANAAEVRFTVPDGTARVAGVSLLGSPQGLVNGDLQSMQQNPGVPDNWTLSPTTATGFLVTVASTATGQQVLLRNTGPNTADLVQTIPVTAGQNFTLIFVGQATVPSGGTNPQLQVRWLDDKGAAVGTAVSEDIAPATFDSHPLAGQVPSGASQAEVHISLPTGAALAVQEVAIRQPKTVSVPVSFVAQSPGQLRVSGAQVAYDTAPPSPPAVPASGLCPPTPPGQQPGNQAVGSCNCPCCSSQTTMTNMSATATPAGRPMTVGQCPTCGNDVVQGGGQPALATQSLRVRVVPPPSQPPILTPATPQQATPIAPQTPAVAGPAVPRQVPSAGTPSRVSPAAPAAAKVAPAPPGPVPIPAPPAKKGTSAQPKPAAPSPAAPAQEAAAAPVAPAAPSLPPPAQKATLAPPQPAVPAVNAPGADAAPSVAAVPTPVSSPGGKPSAASPGISAPTSPKETAAPIKAPRTAPPSEAGPPAPAAAVAPPPQPQELPLTEVAGIGNARAKRLQVAQIKTANDLAAADVKVVSQALRMSPANAAVLIAHAKKLIAQNS
jgi:hypothetical protein